MLKACHRRSVVGCKRSLLIACTGLVLAGCTSGRLKMTVSSEPDVGEHVRTRNHYRIVDGSGKTGQKFATPEGRQRYEMAKENALMARLKRCQPDAFAADGIPVVVRRGRGDYAFSGRASALGVMVFICSVGILPGWTSRDMSRYYVIETIGGKRVDQRVNVDLNYLTVNTAFPFFRWIWLASQGETEVSGGHRAFVTCFSNGDEFGGVFPVGKIRPPVDGYLQRALIYAIAARLKKLEDESDAGAQVPGGDK